MPYGGQSILLAGPCYMAVCFTVRLHALRRAKYFTCRSLLYGCLFHCSVTCLTAGKVFYLQVPFMDLYLKRRLSYLGPCYMAVCFTVRLHALRRAKYFTCRSLLYGCLSLFGYMPYGGQSILLAGPCYMAVCFTVRLHALRRAKYFTCRSLLYGCLFRALSRDFTSFLSM